MRKLLSLVFLSLCCVLAQATQLDTDLIKAVEKNDTVQVLKLLKLGVSPNQVNQQGKALLSIAVKNENIRIVQALLRYKANPNVNNGHPLFVASYDGNLPIMQALIKKKADVNMADEEEGFTPLIAAAEQGHTKAVRMLLDAKANPNKTDKQGWTPLLMTICNGHIDIVKMLLDAKANINASNVEGRTPLINAADNGYIDIVRLLLENNANVNATCKCGKKPQTALSLAQEHGYTDIVNLLKQYGAKE